MLDRWHTRVRFPGALPDILFHSSRKDAVREYYLMTSKDTGLTIELYDSLKKIVVMSRSITEMPCSASCGEREKLHGKNYWHHYN
jgi:hypothetical protein